MTFVLVHGAWCGGWWMSRLASALRHRGADVFAPTLTGLGERAHLASPEVGLSTHIQDVLGVLEYEDLRDVVLVGHSYGGAVVTGVADRARDRIQRLIYMDAFVLKDGQSLEDVCPLGMAGFFVELARQSGEGWRAPSPFTMEQFGVDLPEDIAWNERGMVMHPLKAFVEPLTLRPEPLPFPVTYIRFTERSMRLFDQFSAMRRRKGGTITKCRWTHAAPAVLLVDVAGRRSLAS